MKASNHKTSTSTKIPVFERIERMHPLRMINYLVISVSCILFAFISFLFISHVAFDLKGNFIYQLPKFFVVSTIILIISTHFTFRLVAAFQNDAIAELRNLLSYTLISGLVFFLSQAIAWMEILETDFIYESSKISNYLFLFSGIHFLYILAGVVLTALLFYKYMMIENDPVKTIITTTNPHEKIKLQIFRTYWNFTVWSWSLIFAMLLFIL
jgi:cytochrome c oxidase subunit III